MREHVDLKPYNSFGLSVTARYFCSAESVEQLRAALAFSKEKQLPLLVIGAGSNLLLRADFPGMVVQIAMQGLSVDESDAHDVIVRAQSGENWHRFVSYCLAHGYHGLENLALIPGNVGAAPIQNIGAYGVEVKDFIAAVQVLDIASGQIHTLSNSDCEFGYRDSIFKGEYKERKIVLSVSFRLPREARVNISYKALTQALANAGLGASPQDVFAAVCAVRREKLPDPAQLGNAGSFFKNPIISKAAFADLQKHFPLMPSFALPADEEHLKVPAAWLIEQAGWKDKMRGGAAVYDKQALVIVNKQHASAEDVTTLAGEIMASVWERYGIRLEPEVQWVPAFVSQHD